MLMYSAGEGKLTDNLKVEILPSGFLNLEMNLAVGHGYLLTWMVMWN